MADIELIKKLYNTKSIEEIGNIVGLSRKTIRKILVNNNVKLRSRSETLKITKKNNKVINTINYKSNCERDKIIIEQYNLGIGSYIISKSLNISKKTVLSVLKKNNISRNNKYNKHINIDDVIKRYYAGESFNDISKDYDVCTQTINNNVSDLINKRSPGETMFSLLGKEDEIIKLYNQEYSSYDIAEYFNIKNPDIISGFLKKKGLLRNKEEIRKIVSKKLAKRQVFKSRPQKILEQLLTNKNITFDSEYALDGWNFDIKINNILIEIQSYWHKLPGRINKDRLKKKLAEENNYKLYYLWENQFADIEFIDNFIEYIVSNNHAEFDFNNVVVSVCDYNEAKKCISKWHYIGKIGNCSIALKAEINGETIAVCTFGSVTRIETAIKQGVLPSEILELSRFVIHPKYHKKNFGSYFISKCIKYIKKNYENIKLLVSFADMSYNHEGIIYKASNWVYDGQTSPNYWYVKDGRTIVHKKSVWNKAKKDNIPINEYVKNNGLVKVIGEKKNRYIYKLR